MEREYNEQKTRARMANRGIKGCLSINEEEKTE